MYWDGMGGGARVTFTVRPTPVASDAVFGRPSLNFAGNCFGTATVTQSDTSSMLVVARGSSNDTILLAGGGGIRALYNTPTGKWGCYNGTQKDSTVSLATPAIELVRWGTASKLYVNARTPATGNWGAKAQSTEITVGAYSGSRYCNGVIAEVVITTTQTDANDLNLLNQAAAYYGFTLGA